MQSVNLEVQAKQSENEIESKGTTGDSTSPEILCSKRAGVSKKYSDFFKLMPAPAEIEQALNASNQHNEYDQSLISNVLSKQDTLFSWFEQDANNIETFLNDPLNSFITATQANAEAVKELFKESDHSFATILGQLTSADGAQTNEKEALLDSQSLTAESTATTSDVLQWQTSLPHTGSNVVSVLTVDDVVYAGSNGYIYLMDNASGKILQHNDLSGRGNHQVRLALSNDGSTLFAGTDGYAIALNATTLETLWQTSLPHTGDNIISLLVDGNILYAAGDGYVYKLDTNKDGEIVQNNGLKGRGNHEIRLALSSDNSQLFVGTDGYALALNADNLDTQWQTSLPHTGDNVISLLVSGDTLYAAGNGYVYKLDTQNEGEIVQHNNLDGRGKHEVRLALSDDNNKLLVGTDGYALALNADNLDTQWQTSLPHTGDNIISLLVAGDTLYAAGNGYIYQIRVNSPDGFIYSSDNLSGMGNHEVRLAMSADKLRLLIGTNGYTLARPSSYTQLTSEQHWQTSLPHTGDNVISVLATNSVLYAAGDGYVYKLDTQTNAGSILAHNDLTGRGNHEIRMLLSVDEKTLYLGTDGYALALDADSLTTQWQTSLPNTSSNVISLALANDMLYAAGNGYVYKLDTKKKGEIVQNNGLKSRGKHEVRLALSSDNGQLFVGTGGYALALSADDLETQWQTSLPHTGDNAISLVVLNNMLYAAGHGYVYKLDTQNEGEITEHNNLDGRGKHEVRLALSEDNSKLFIGTDGYALALNADNLDTQWQTSLPHTGDNVISVLVAGDTLYAAGNGYLYQLWADSSDGEIYYANNLKGMGNHQVRLCLSPSGTQIFLGTDGYALARANYGDLAAGWPAMFALSCSQLNSTLADLHQSGKLPNEFKKEFKVDKKFICTSDLTIGAPEVVSGAMAQAEVKIPLSGKIDVKLSLGKVKLFSVTISGSVAVTLDLQKIEIDFDNNELTLKLADKALFDAIDLANLTIDSPVTGEISLEEYQEIILSLLNHAVNEIKPIAYPLTLPAYVSNAQVRLSYTSVPAPLLDFISVLVGTSQKQGSWNLSPETIAVTGPSTSAIVLSNNACMGTIKDVLNYYIKKLPLNLTFEQTNEYLSVVQNNSSVNFDIPLVFHAGINKGGVTIQFSDNNSLAMAAKLKVSVPLSLILRGSVSVDLTLALSVEDGKLKIKTDGDASLPWFLWLVPAVKIVLDEVINHYVNPLLEHDLWVTIPGYQCEQLNAPGYIQISGQASQNEQ